MVFRLNSFRQLSAGLRLDTLTLGLFAAASWIATHRYHGIWHDGVLYAGQAIFRLDSIPFAKDLFFAYGSQDSFTAFTRIYALAIDHIGLPTAAAVLLGLAHVVWVAAVAWLLRGVVAGLSYWLTLILLSTLPATYGSLGVFSYGETFLTARTWAEAAALLAVACVVHGHRFAAIAGVAFAAAMHPVIAFPAALFVVFFGLNGRQQGTLALLGLLILLTLKLAEVSPLVNVSEVMDPLWLDLSVTRSPFVFLDQWPFEAHLEPLFLALLLTTAGLTALPGNRRLWWSALAVFFIGMGLALLAVYWPGALLIQMQPWRVLWLVKVLGITAGCCLLQSAWHASPYSRLLLGALVACAFALQGTGLVCAVPLAALLVAQQRFGVSPRLPPWLTGLAWGVIVLVIGENIFWRVKLASITVLSQVPLADRLFIVSKDVGWLVFPSLVLGAWCLLRRRPASAGWLLVFSSVLLLYFASHWQRTTRHQVMDDRLQKTGYAELTTIIQPHHLTYWSEEHAKLWFILRRGSYASTQQAAGSIFSRQTAIEAERRLSRLKKLGLPDSRFDWLPKTTDGAPEVLDHLDGLIHVCHDPILDFVVLSKQVVGASPVASFSIYYLEHKYHLYACTSLRAFPDPYPPS